MTPREFDLYLMGQQQAEVGRWQRALWAAWHVAAFSRQKRLSPEALKRFIRRLGDDGESRVALTPEQFYGKLRVWHAMLGGTQAEGR